MAICQGCGNRGCRQENDDDEAGKHQAGRDYRGVTVAAVNEGIYQREHDGECVADRARPGRPIDPPAADKVDQLSDSGHARHD